MRNLRKALSTLSLIGIGLGINADGQAASGAGPYYATPSWDQTLQCDTAATCPRFIVLTSMNSEAVLDRETGLVWEKTPSASPLGWFNASFHCLTLNTGGRTGWRLPALPELLSLMDRSQKNPALPAGHPFTVTLSFYWSATSMASAPTNAFNVNVGSGSVGAFGKANPDDISDLAWCVRGGAGGENQ